MSRNISTPALEGPRLAADRGPTHAKVFMIIAVAILGVAAAFYVVDVKHVPLGDVLATSSSVPDPAASPRPRAVVRPVSSEALPNVKGKRITTVLVEFPPAGFSPPHHHGGSVTSSRARCRRCTGRARPSSSRPVFRISWPKM
jgi:hypothetical protein